METAASIKSPMNKTMFLRFIKDFSQFIAQNTLFITNYLFNGQFISLYTSEVLTLSEAFA